MRITFLQRRNLQLGCPVYIINLDGIPVGKLYPHRDGHFERRGQHDWYFVVGDPGIPLRNTCGERGRSLKEVQDAAKAYIRKCVEARRSDGGQS